MSINATGIGIFPKRSTDNKTPRSGYRTASAKERIGFEAWKVWAKHWSLTQKEPFRKWRFMDTGMRELWIRIGQAAISEERKHG